MSATTRIAGPIALRTRVAFAAVVGVAVALAPRESRAQTVRSAPLATIGGESDERARLAQLVGDSSAAGYLLRSASSMTRLPVDTAHHVSLHVPGVAPADFHVPTFGVLDPSINAVENSALPFSMNDGPLWAGRGWNMAATAGVFVATPSIRVIFAPTLLVEQNKFFQILPYPDLGQRSDWANPFHPLPESIDLPLRFGDHTRVFLDAGQSSITGDFRAASFGIATENEWWGPGIRNALVLSNNAAGFPHAFIRTRQPLKTRAGTFDARWLLGSLAESGFFNDARATKRRSITGAALTWTPTFDSTLAIGATRLVMASSNRTLPLDATFNVFRSAGHQNADTSTNPLPDGRDQIFSLFARWVFPTAGFEAYTEWARFEEPVSLRDFLEFPQHSQGYTLGLQWAHPLTSRRTFQLQSEASYLEPDPSLRVRPVATTYTSHGVPQGFTQRGQTLGAAIGPGSSSQWLAGDLFAPRWRFGTYLGRIRWDNGVLYEPIVPELKRQDVTLFAGLRGSVSWKDYRLTADFAHAARFNYLFQGYVLAGFNHTGGVDLLNNTLSLTLSAAFGQR